MRGLEVDVHRLLDELGIQARKSGDELRGHCPEPSHRQRPGPGSWQIKFTGPKRGQHTCYACGFGGGPVALVAARLQIDRRAAWAWLQDRFGHGAPLAALPTWRRKIQRAQRGQRLRYPRGTVALWRDPPAELAGAVRYAHARGLTPEELERYRVGAVPTEVPGYGGRLVLPVVVDGRMVDFVARLYVRRPATTPKALSGRRDRGAVKELSLWGYDHLDPSISTVHVVEGIWAALALLHAGIPNVTAACGSAWSQERTELLNPWPHVVLIPDGDLAGAKLERAASSLRFAHQVRVVDLPTGTQPDDHPPEALREMVAAARPARFARSAHVSVGFRRKAPGG